MKIPSNLPKPAQPQEPGRELLTQLRASLAQRLILVLGLDEGNELVLLKRCLAELALPTGWMVLTTRDNDPDYFQVHLSVAICSIYSGSPGESHSQAPSSPEDGVIALINRCTDIEQDFLLVMEGYGKIHRPEIHQAVTLLVDYLPPAMHILLISRDEPPLPLPRWRVRRQLAQISWPQPPRPPAAPAP